MSKKERNGEKYKRTSVTTNSSFAKKGRTASFSNYPPPEGALLFVGRRTSDLIVVERERMRSSEVKDRTAVPESTFVEYDEEWGVGCNP